MSEANWLNRTIWAHDNLDIIRGMNSESVDLIYLDPPFNSNRTYSAPIGSEAAGAAFKDTWSLNDVDLAWLGEIAEKSPAIYAVVDTSGKVHSKAMQSYLTMMSVRIIEFHRLLKDTGTLYLHCDPTASHYLKLILDSIFGAGNLRNEIVWSYKRWTASSKLRLPALHDIIFCYGKSDQATLNPVLVSNTDPNSSQYVSAKDDSGKTIVKRDEHGKPIRRELSEYLTVGDVWPIPILSPNAKERVGYPTQKPLRLLERIIQSGSNEGDLVFDPFCGCATTLVAAEKLGRQWAGIDLSDLAIKLVQERLKKEMGMFYDVTARTDIPTRTDLGKIPPYKTQKHTLYGQQEGYCNGCKSHFQFRNMTIDHIVPKKRGGMDNVENLQLLCGACNSKKGGKSQEEFLALMKREGYIS